MGREWGINELTLGYEWETLLLDEYGLPPKHEKIATVVSKTRKEILPSRTGFDWIPGLERSLFEIRSGILRNRKELEVRTKKIVKTAMEIVKKEGFQFLPIGSYPPLGSAIGLHIHTGSWEKIEDLHEFANSIFPYIPCFAALSVNSPFWGMNPFNPPFGVKSYRLKHHAQSMSIPQYTPNLFPQLLWEGDITIKFVSHPTIEIRICDAPLSWKLVCELTAFVSSFIAESIKYPKTFNKQQFVEGIDNRMRAMKDGLQALFLWGGKEREVTEILKEMLDTAYPTLKILGYEELSLIEKMIQLRQTQTDFLSHLFENYKGDIIDFTTYLASGLNFVEDPFNTYLNYAPPLKVKDLMDIDEYLLSMVGRRTSYGNLYKVLYQPTDEFEKRIWRLKERNLLDIQFDEEEGTLFSKSSS